MNLDCSVRVRAEHWDESWFLDRLVDLDQSCLMHRKVWEWATIAQVYRERAEYKSLVLGFGCGKEPLAAFFASQGSQVIASDLGDAGGEWTETEQHSNSLRDLPRGHCPEEDFKRLIEFRSVDMREIPKDLLRGQFGFTWSAGSFEHIGGIEAGIKFFCRQMECLKPGGIAAHTTELNTVNGSKTLEKDNLCLYRKSDLRFLKRRLQAQGDRLLPLDLVHGNRPEDWQVDKHPYTAIPHLVIETNGYTTTSVLLVAERQS